MPASFVYTIKTAFEQAGAEAALAMMERENGKAMALGKACKYSSEQVEAARSAIAKYKAEVAATEKAEQEAAAAATKAATEAKAIAEAKLAAESKAAAEAKAAASARAAAEAKALADTKAAANARIELSKKISADFQNKGNEATRQQVQSSFDKKTADAKAAADAELAAKTKAAADAKAAASQAAKSASAQAAKELAEQNKQVGEFQQKLAEVVPAFSRVQSVIGGLVSGPIAMLTIALGAVGVAVGFAKKGLQDFVETSQHIARLDAALARTGQLTDATREKFVTLAEGMPKGIGMSTEQWIDAITRLTQFGANAGNIEKSAEAVKNFAGVTGDLNTAVMGVAKAMQGNFTVFSRWGIYIDQHASQSKKLAQLYAELAKIGGGQLEATNKTLGGQWAAMRGQLNGLLKTFSQNVAEGYNLSSALGRVNDTLKDLNTATQHTPSILDGLKNSQAGAVESANDLAQAEAGQASAIDQTAEAAKRALSALEELLAAQDRRREQADEEANARMALDLEVVDQGEKIGTISKADAIAIRYQIRQKYAEAAHQAEIASLKERMAMEQNYLDMLDQELKRRAVLAQMQAVRAQVSDKMAALPISIQDSLATEARSKEELRALDEKMPGDIAVWQPGTKERARLEKEYADRRKALQDAIASAQGSTASNRKKLRDLRSEFPAMATPAEEKELAKKLEREAAQYDRENTEPANRTRSDIQTTGDRIDYLNRVYNLKNRKEAIQAGGEMAQANTETLKNAAGTMPLNINREIQSVLAQFSQNYQASSADIVSILRSQVNFSKTMAGQIQALQQQCNQFNNWFRHSRRDF